MLHSLSRLKKERHGIACSKSKQQQSEAAGDLYIVRVAVMVRELLRLTVLQKETMSIKPNFTKSFQTLQLETTNA